MKTRELLTKLKERGYTQRKIATILDVAPYTVSRWRASNRVPKEEYEERLIDLLTRSYINSLSLVPTIDLINEIRQRELKTGEPA